MESYRRNIEARERAARYFAFAAGITEREDMPAPTSIRNIVVADPMAVATVTVIYYRLMGHSFSRIADMCCIPKTTVFRICRRHGL